MAAARIKPKRPIRLYLAERRERLGLTQEQLGNRLGVSGVTIGRWEAQRGSHKPNSDVIAALAEALDCEPTDLYRHPDTPSADALLRGQAPEVIDNAIRIITAIRKAG